MVVAVTFSHAEKEGNEANRRSAKNYYRDAFMARAWAKREGFTSGNLLGTFQEPSREFCNMTSVLQFMDDQIRDVCFQGPSGYLAGASRTLELCILERKM